MLKFLKKIFSNSGAEVSPKPVATKAAPKLTSRPPEASGGVEVAALSLRAILDKLPADLRATINQMPSSEVKVVLPIAAIMKQLSSGTVRMSLASLYRQAPAGTFRGAITEDKRLVDVPLSEVFRTVNPTALKRRDDQRAYDVPQDAVGLFDETSTRRVVAPPQSGIVPPPAQPLPVVPASSAPERKLSMPGSRETPPQQPPQTPVSAPARKAPAAPTGPGINLNSELSLLFVEIAAGWPEGDRNELSVLPGGTRLSIPASEVGPLLQKGRVAFTWERIRRWLTPPPKTAINISDETLFVLPLKIVAPAFVAATGARKRSSEADTSLPDFFGPTAGTTPAPQAKAPAPEAEVPAPSEVPATPVESSAPLQMPVSLPTAAPQSTPPAVVLPPASIPAAAAPAVLSLAREAVPAPAVRAATTLCELFSLPGKTDWAPHELVKLTSSLAGVVGAVVALEEGLVVAQQLPEALSAETFAAFMPQIFSRMDKYTGEMQLGSTNDITLNTGNGPIRLFRSGKVFFAALGKSGGSLPDGLHLICNELAGQNT